MFFNFRKAQSSRRLASAAHHGFRGIEPLEHRTLLAGSGLAAAYFARTNLTAAKYSQVDSAVDFDWQNDTPHTVLGTDGFSVRWTGRLLAKLTEPTTFTATTSGGVRLWVDGELIIDAWSDHSLQQNRGVSALKAGQLYDIRMDYWNSGDEPAVKLEWENERMPRDIVPTNRLHPATLDTARPTTPSRFRSTFTDEDTIKVMWNASSDASGVVCYDVYVGKTKVYTTAPGELSYTRDRLTPDTGYTFSLQAVDAAGNLSATANTAVTTTAPTQRPPSVPTDVQITSKTHNTISLSWSASTDDVGVTGYRVYRNGVKLNVIPTGTTFTDTGLSPDTQYSYRIRAADAAPSFSGYSAPVTTTTDSEPVQVTINPYAGINGNAFSQQNGVSTSGSDLISLDSGDWVRYSNVDFGSGSAMSVRLNLALALSNRGGAIEIRLDGVGGTLVGTHQAQVTGSWSTYLQQQINITAVSGVHDVYLVFKNRSGVANLRSTTFSTQRLTQVMPLGDSITHQSTATDSYRYLLWKKLEAGGYGDNADFVGSETGAWDGDPPKLDFDQNHEGHVGWRADEIANSVAGWASAARPDVVLLHIGTNDVRQGQSTASTVEDIGRIIDNLRSALPNVKILLAQIIPALGFESQIDELNSQLPGLAAAKSSAQSPVSIVDQHTGFSLSTDTSDGLHPNPSGDNKMADRWYAALTPLLQ